jgi:ligand-binding sensor domain-containing protein
MLVRILFCYCFLNGFFDASAQQPLLYFDKLTIENGLSNNKVNCILQDRRGFIWVGTDDGLNRYDGHNFLVFRHEPGNNNSISGNIITDLIEDSSSIIWIATTDGGLTKYDYHLPPSGQFRAFRHLPNDSNSIPVNIINSLLEDNRGNIWLATSGAGILRFDKKQEIFVSPFKEKVKTALVLSMDANGIIWAGREGRSMIKFNPNTLEYEADSRYDDVYNRLPHSTVTSLYRDKEKNMWIGSWDKALYRYNYATKREEVFDNATSAAFPPDEAYAFLEDLQQRLWIGGRYNGLYIFNNQTNQFYHYQHDPSRQGTIISNTIHCLFRDRNNNTWIGTNEGISVYRPQQQQFEQVFLPDIKEGKDALNIYDICQDAVGKIWIGTSKGIAIWDKDAKQTEFRKLQYKGLPLHITKFYSDKTGRFFVGTDYSLFEYNPKTSELNLLPNTEKDVVMNKIISSRVVSVMEDTLEGKPVLLVSPYGHFLTYYDWQEQKWVSRTDSVQKIINRYDIKDNLIRKFFKSGDGELWIATVKEGLGKWSKKDGLKISYYHNNPADTTSISNNNIYDIASDEKNNLWVSTYGGGLHFFDPRKENFQHIGATNNLLEGIATDNSGNVWMVSNGNLQQYDPVRKIQNSFELPDLEKTGGVRGYIFKDREGYMYVKGSNYFIRFMPSAIHKERSQPVVMFTDFKIFDESQNHLLFEKEIALKYNQNYFTINYAAPWFKNEGNIYYSYMLEGVDDKWIDAGTQTTAPYTNLNGGDYIFKVRATTTSGVWGTDIATLKIRIIPPFWKRLWFFLLCALMMLSIVYALYRYRINEVLKREAMRNKIAQDLHDNVGSTLSSIAVYSEVAQYQQSKNDTLALQSVLQKIGITSNEMISEMNDIVWAINPRNDSMEKILERMESFARPLLAAQDIHFRFDYDPGVLHLDLNMEHRKNFYLVFKESVNNVIKYSCATALEVKVNLTDSQLLLSVQDNGKGFDPLTISGKSKVSMGGNGLQNMQLRAKEMKGNLQIESALGKGTVLLLSFPV